MSTLPAAGTARYAGNARLAATRRNTSVRRQSICPYIQHDPKDVLFFVPSRSKYNQSLDALLAAVGRDAFERTRKAFDASGRPAGYRHVGWRWPCDCTAFARSQGDYLWVPCSGHEPRPQTKSEYAPAERPSYVATDGVPERRTGTA